MYILLTKQLMQKNNNITKKKKTKILQSTAF